MRRDGRQCQRAWRAIHRRGAAHLVLVLLVLMGAAAAGAVEPLTGAGGPQELVDLLARAVKDRDPAAYADCLADSFRFVPYHGIVSRYPDIDWKHWGRRKETAFADGWLGPDHTAGLDLGTVLDRSELSPDEVEWDILYTMTLDGAVFRSRAVFVMRRLGFDWYLAAWIDTTIETDQNGAWLPTSGEARALPIWF